MKTLVSAIVLLIATIGSTPMASGSAFAPLYSTTDLGPSYTLLTGSDGTDYGVANSSGSVVYAFDKAPVTSINVSISNPDGIAAVDNWTVLTMAVGGYQVGYTNVRDPIWGNDYTFASFEGETQGWIGGVSDLNKQGQAVGTSAIYEEPLVDKGASYAGFSAVGLVSHGGDAQVSDNLNNYIISIPGVTLTSAMKIDDLGRIIAEGSDGNDYLLTPLALGPPATAPEPTALAVLGVASAGLAIRRRLHR